MGCVHRLMCMRDATPVPYGGIGGVLSNSLREFEKSCKEMVRGCIAEKQAHATGLILCTTEGFGYMVHRRCKDVIEQVQRD